MLEKEILDYCIERLKELDEFEKGFFQHAQQGKNFVCYDKESYRTLRNEVTKDKELIFSIFEKIIDNEEIQKIMQDSNKMADEELYELFDRAGQERLLREKKYNELLTKEEVENE